MDTFREQQLNAIKKRVLNIFEQKKEEAQKCNQKVPTIYSLYHELQDKYNDLGISYSTFRNTLTACEKGSADLYTILALCHHWHIDTSFIFSAPEVDEERMPPISDMISLSNGNFVILDDAGYMGKFYGYMHSQNTNYKKHLVEFELIIGEENGRVEATMNYVGPSGNKRVFHGIPIRSTKRSTIFIIFTMEDGNYFIFQYGYKKYAIRNLYYRKGLALTTSSVTYNPMVQSFVLLERSIIERKKKYIDGILPLADSEFYISKNEYQALVNSIEVVKKFDERLSFLFSMDEDIVYQISENQIYDTLQKRSYQDIDLEEVSSALNVLKDHSLAPTRLQYGNCQPAAAFARRFLQEIHYPEDDIEDINS